MDFIEERKNLRKILGDALPEDLNTDFNLDRWLANYVKDFDLCVERVKEYLEIRSAFGHTKESLKNFNNTEEFLNYCEIFGLSTFEEVWVNELDNGLIFMECGVMEPSKAPHVIRAADYTRLTFGYNEYFQSLILQHEKKSGKPSHGICYFDMQNVNIIDYINPYSSINKLFQSRVQLWFDYYGELLKHAILINPPTFLSALIQVMSIILPEKLLSRFIFIHNEPYDILPYLTVEAIPTFCGGSKEISVLPISRKIDREEYIMEGEIWSEHNIIEVPYEEITINTSKTFVTTLQVKSGQTLLYEYFASRDYEISCVHGSVLVD
uniref:CRAL-TRIO domain-containing protein n=1 Tax=Acrobeloides nanus TaxID=290746 RepID=A0A914ELD1_9BILA